MSDDEDYGMSDSDGCYSDSQGGSDYGEGDLRALGSDDDGGDDYALSTDDLVVIPRHQFRVLDESKVKEKMAAAVQGVVSVLSVPPSQAALLLRASKWSVSRVHDEWFSDEAGTRERVGLPPAEAAPAGSDGEQEPVLCQICFEEAPPMSTRTAGCGHYYCSQCWRGYVANAVSEGPGCLCLQCPDPKCKMVAPEELMLEMSPPEQVEKLRQFQWRTYVDESHRLKWCPAPDCDQVVECEQASAQGLGVDVQCACGSAFCFGCQEEAHRPVDCETVRTWLVKNSAESENMNWILANTKPCPKCKRPIEKNQGCMHMTCQAPCKYEFCWLCSGPWKEHGERTGGFYACNRYETSKREGELDEEEQKRHTAKSSLERYMHYYERWAAHGSAHKKAREDLDKMTDEELQKLGDAQNTPVSQLKCVLDAMGQIAECRRILKWTYAFGYYSLDGGDQRTQHKKKFFEFIQGDAESHLERLTEAVEVELAVFFTEPRPGEVFADFRGKLAGITAVTRKYFQTLVTELEGGLPGLGDLAGLGEGSGSGGGAAPMEQDGAPPALTDELNRIAGHWQCVRCTYANELRRDECFTCGHARGQPAPQH